MIFTSRIKTVLSGAINHIELKGLIMTDDDIANQLIIELFNGSGKYLLPQDTLLVGYFTRSDGEIFESTGYVTNDGEACVVFPTDIYEIPGLIKIVVKILEDPYITPKGIDYEHKITIASCSCVSKTTSTDNIIEAESI